MPEKKKFLSQLKKEVKIADRILIATDPDREGEAIAADIASEIKGDIERVEFTEITKQAVLEAVNNSRKINYDLVDAQRARRAIDRIVGFSFSPLLRISLWSLNNKGLSEVVDNLKKERDVIIGANIGKNYFTQNNDAHSDYLKCLSELNEFVDYFAINISSPNTKGLRDLHDKSLLKPFLEKLVKFNNKQMNKRPLLLKISPDLNEEQIADIVVLIKDLKLDGIIATNTTVSRDGATSKHKTQEGGMSGKLLTHKSNAIIKYLRKSLGEKFPIIGVGGIMSANDAIERLNSGADLIQLYTGFIYKGPSLIKEINKAIINQNN